MICSNSKQRVTNKAAGFTLLELAVVLLIIGLVTSMAMVSGVAVVETARQSATQKKMAAIDDALQSYRSTYNRLPCPASLTIAEGVTNFGVEAATPGTCTGGTPAANYSAAGTTNTGATGVEGAVPVVTLGLANDFMYDGWGHRFRYAVDKDVTATGAFPTIASQCTGHAISILTAHDNTASPITGEAIYALISHGANGHGGYTKQGVISSTANTNSDKQMNCHCNASATPTTFAPTYVQREPTLSASDAFDSFDDLVSYKEIWQLRNPNLSSTAAACGSSSEVVAVCDWNYVDPDSRVHFFTISGNSVTSSLSTQVVVGGCNPAYSPDGTALVLARPYASTDSPFYSVAADGKTLSGPIAITNYENIQWNPVFSPDGGYVIGPNGTSGAWVYSYSGGVFTHVTDIVPSIPYGVYSVAADSSATHVVLGMGGNGATAPTSPILIYKRSGATFNLLAGQPDVQVTESDAFTRNKVMFSPDGTYLYLSDTNNGLVVYKVAGDIFTYLAGQPASNVSGTGGAIAVDPTNTYIAIGESYAGTLAIYKRSGDVFTKLSSIPAPTAEVYDLTFTKSGQYLAVNIVATPWVQVYKVNSSNDTFTLLADPSPVPTGDLGNIATPSR